MASAFYNEKPLNEKDTEEEGGVAQTSFVAREDEPRPAVADAFALREGDEDQEDFKTLGWFKAGLVLTCEVSHSSSHAGTRDRTSSPGPYPLLLI